MPNIALVLREEILRLARKEIRGQTEALRKASVQHRKAIADMKRRASELERRIIKLTQQVSRDITSPVTEVDVGRVRFSAKGLRSHRKRLCLSADAYAKLIGVTRQTVYKWESEASRPRKQQLGTLATFRRMRKREAHALLEELG